MEKLSKKDLKNYRINNFIRLFIYLILIVTGVCLYAKSYFKVNNVIKYYGVVILVIGALLVYLCGKEKKINISDVDFIYGVLVSLTGLLLIINPGDISNCLTFYLGIYFAISAFQKIYVAIFLFKKKNECALITLVSAIIMLFIGVLVFLNPFNKLMILEVCGLFSIFFGLIGFANALLLNKHSKEILKKN